jgi:CheY-like chemotaxis protein
VEDNPLEILTIRYLLEDSGHKPEIVESYENAIRIILKQAGLFQVALIDGNLGYGLEHSSGFEIIPQLRWQNPSIAVVSTSTMGKLRGSDFEFPKGSDNFFKLGDFIDSIPQQINP